MTTTALATSNGGITTKASITVVYAKACVVPGVRGDTRNRAETAIKYAGCRTTKLERVSSKVKKGHAVGTKQKKGKKLNPGSGLELILSKG